MSPVRRRVVAPTAVAVGTIAVLVLAACSSDADQHSAGNYCTQVGDHLDDLEKPDLTTQADIDAMLSKQRMGPVVQLPKPALNLVGEGLAEGRSGGGGQCGRAVALDEVREEELQFEGEFLDVERQRPQRGQVQHPRPRARVDRWRTLGRWCDEPVDTAEERGQRLAAAGRCAHQCVTPRLDGRPALHLRWCGLGEGGGEPRPHRGREALEDWMGGHSGRLVADFSPSRRARSLVRRQTQRSR